jgi:hypothetical protein
MNEEALAWNFVCLVHISRALGVRLFWLWLTIIIMSDGDHAWWLAAMLALACVVSPLLRVLFVVTILGRVASLHSRSVSHSVGREETCRHVPLSLEGSVAIGILVVVVADGLWIWAWLRTRDGLEIDVKVSCASVLTISSMSCVDKTILVTKSVIIVIA